MLPGELFDSADRREAVRSRQSSGALKAYRDKEGGDGYCRPQCLISSRDPRFRGGATVGQVEQQQEECRIPVGQRPGQWRFVDAVAVAVLREAYKVAYPGAGARAAGKSAEKREPVH